jgi:hypothetical protein
MVTQILWTLNMLTNQNKTLLRAFILFFGLLISYQAWSFGEPCFEVATKAGAQIYQPEPKRIASLLSLAQLPKEFELTLLERNGAWHIYQTMKSWFSPGTCAPLQREYEGKVYDFMPVLLNKQSGSSAVVIGSLIIKTYQEEDLYTMESTYGFKMLTQLPNPRMAIFDVKPTTSYDVLLETLENDKDIEYAVPLFSEPRYRTR